MTDLWRPELANRFQRRVEKWRRALRDWMAILWLAAREAIAPESQLIASSIGYFTLFSLFPMLLLVVAIASQWLDPLLAEAKVVAELEFVAPALQSLLGSDLEGLVTARGPVTGLALLTLFWSASSVFNVLTRAMDKIWGADINHSRSVWRHRGLAIIMLLIITSILLLGSTAEGTILTILNSLLPPDLGPYEPLTTGFWAVLLNVALFAILYYFTPHVRLTWRSVLPGAILGGLLWELAKRAFLLFVANYLSRSNLVYGSVATITAFLGWVYISSIIFLFGAFVNREAFAARDAQEIDVAMTNLAD